jgi:hypothetical protein
MAQERHEIESLVQRLHGGYMRIPNVRLRSRQLGKTN